MYFWPVSPFIFAKFASPGAHDSFPLAGATGVALELFLSLVWQICNEAPPVL